MPEKKTSKQNNGRGDYYYLLNKPKALEKFLTHIFTKHESKN